MPGCRRRPWARAKTYGSSSRCATCISAGEVRALDTRPHSWRDRPAMIRTGEEYRAGLRDGREVWIDGERVADVTAHPAFRPIVDAKARMYDMAHEPTHAARMVFAEAGDNSSVLFAPPTEQAHWHEKWRALDLYFNDIGGVVTRVGDETVGEMWSLLDGRDVLNEIDPRFADNIE